MSGIYTVQAIYLCDLVTLVGMLVGILVILLGAWRVWCSSS